MQACLLLPRGSSLNLQREGPRRATTNHKRRPRAPRTPIHCIAWMPGITRAFLALTVCGGRASIQSERHSSLARAYQSGIRYGEHKLARIGIFLILRRSEQLAQRSFSLHPSLIVSIAGE